MIAPADLAQCAETIRTGSYSFHAASRLLPAAVRDRALVLYAFCRLADDAVDDSSAKGAALAQLQDRLALAYDGRPWDRPTDRAFAALVADQRMPRALPEALLEGFAWDAEGRMYQGVSDVRAYAARVAASVGAMMCVLMDVRDRDRLARACDLGLAMQLTNIARDVGEDARAGRLYLPLEWLDEVGVTPARFLADPAPSPAMRALVARMLAEAERSYRRAMPGVLALPLGCRPGIAAARLIYGGIGPAIARNGHDSITQRARTGAGRKLMWLAQASVISLAATLWPKPATLHARPDPETAFLVEAASLRKPPGSRSDTLITILQTLRAQDMRET